ncbi:MAG: tetratricopeptide repeat protein [Candidatus Rokuibacteriota bacterium]
MTLADALARLRSAEPSARRTALEAIGRLGDGRVTEEVAPCLHDEDAGVVAAAEATLWQVWSRSGDAAVDELFAEGGHAMERRDWLGAVSAFGRVIEAAPGFTEAWNKRATARYLAEHYALAIADCEEVLRRNPHHFGALSGQGLCHVALGQLADAARCFRRALAVHPRLESVRQNLARVLERLVRGNGHAVTAG